MLTAEKIAELLGLALPQDVTLAELAEWAEWWRESAELAQSMTPEHVAYRKAGGWWPPATSRHVNEIAPMVVCRALRPGMEPKTGDNAARSNPTDDDAAQAAMARRSASRSGTETSD